MTCEVCPALGLRWITALLHLGKRSWWMTFLVWLVAIAPARAALELRVAIEQDVSQVEVGSSGASVVRDGSGQVLGQLPASGGSIEAQASGGRVQIGQWEASEVWIEPTGNSYVYIDGNYYRGLTQVVSTSGGITAVNHVDLEDYLYSVVGGEMPTSWPLEALKAQAVAARSFVLYRRQTGANAVFDVGDTTRWQVYKGIEEETESTIAAVNGTTGQVLIHNGQIIEAVFHSCSGGHTENVEDVWSGSRAYLRGVPDFDTTVAADCRQWVREFTASAMQQRITGVGNILSFVPERTTPNGRIISMRVVGDQGTRTLRGDELRSALDLRSTKFTIVPQIGDVASTGSVASTPVGFQVVGSGFGHGLGMSQWGAYSLAQQGYNYQQIVTYYYQGAGLAVIQVQ